MGRDSEEAKTTVAQPGALTALLGELASAPEVTTSWADALTPGMVVGRFELLRELGRGGFGVVWEARDRELGRSVAFKAVKAGDPGGVREERLVREAEAAARLSHPNVVTLFDIGRSEHGPYLIMELLRGETLSQRLLRGPLPVREALRVAADVARGLAHAHAAGVVHRDVKPGNIFVCADRLVKLLDLGMAQAFGHKAFAGGSPYYMAPEQWSGRGEDQRTDVFALGVVLHEMLSGDVPWPGEGGKGVLGTAPPAALDLPTAPDLAALVARMIDRDPARRPRDAGAVLAELEGLSRALDEAPRRGGQTRTGWIARAGEALGRRRGGTGAVTPSPGPSIAVLPFSDLSPGQDQEHLSDGVAEEIRNALARVEGLRVAARTSSFAFRGQRVDVREIGRQLGVGAVVEGSVRSDGARVRVTAHVIGVAEGLTLWSEQYDRQLTDLFAVQDEIARAVAGALQVKLLPGRGPGGAPERATSPEAYGHYLHGRQFHARGTPEGYRAAVEAHSSALAIDPDYAPAWAGVGIGLAMLWSAAGDETLAGVPDLRRRALEAAERAVALAPGRSDGYAVRATLRAMTFDWKGAEEDLERALSIDPGDVRALRTRGWLLAAHGRIAESIEAEQRAGALDPLNPAGWVNLAVRHLSLNDVPAAQEALALAAEVAPGSPSQRSVRLLACLVSGDGQASLAAAGELDDERSRLWGAALAHHALGHARASDRALETLATRFGHRVAYPVAQVEAFRGRADEAFRWLDRALERREVALESIAFDPLFRGLRADPRYAAVLASMGLAPGGGGRRTPAPSPARRQADTAMARVADDAARQLEEERARAGGRSGQTVHILADAIAAAHSVTRLRTGRRWLKVVLAVAAVGALVAAVLGAVVIAQRRQLRELVATKEHIDQEIRAVEAAMEAETDPARLAELEQKLADLSGRARSTIGAVAERDRSAARALEESGDELDAAIRRILVKFDASTYAVPPVFKQALREQVDALAGSSNLKFVYARRNRYWRVITKEFSALGLPEELAYIAWAETQFDPEQESPAGAAGMWQMTASTARDMGLRVDDQVDERFDVPKQTRAAARKIATLLAEFGSDSFMLALASYNRGEAGVRRVLRAVALEKDGFRKEKRDFWHLYRLKRLPPETRDYVPRVLAAAVVCSDPVRYGLEPARP